MSYQTRQATASFPRYVKSAYNTIYDAYKKPSRDKWRAWNHCRNLCNAFGGFNLKVISKNTYMFTAGFQYIDEDSGEERFMYITPSYEVVISPC